MVEIKIPPPEANRVAGQLRNAANQLMEIRNDLYRSLNELRGRWRGDAEIAYAAGFERRVQRLNDRVQLLLDIARALDAIALAGKQGDQAAKAVAPG